MGNDYSLSSVIPASFNFNPRSRVGNDANTAHLLKSINNFNPRSRVGNDPSPFLLNPLLNNFNPRSRVGNDRYMSLYTCCLNISIHVPAWGTTDFHLLYLYKHMRFQSTFPRGERLAYTKNYMSIERFQSTFPRGERLCFSRR